MRAGSGRFTPPPPAALGLSRGAAAATTQGHVNEVHAHSVKSLATPAARSGSAASCGWWPPRRTARTRGHRQSRPRGARRGPGLRAVGVGRLPRRAPPARRAPFLPCRPPPHRPAAAGAPTRVPGLRLGPSPAGHQAHSMAPLCPHLTLDGEGTLWQAEARPGDGEGTPRASAFRAGQPARA